MKEMGAYFKYWADPNDVIVKEGQPDAIIDWLSMQTPETWHRVVMTWNDDQGDKVLSWILSQNRCDRGTAARVVDVEGLGHWLGDKELAQDPDHLCSIGLKNWAGYGTGELRHNPQNKLGILERVRECMAIGMYAGTPIPDVVQYAGSRDALSEFEAEDGKIVVAFEHWTKTNGIEITDRGVDSGDSLGWLKRQLGSRSRHTPLP
jgi:hypothetical protein